MIELGLMVRLEAKEGKEKELSNFIKSAITLAQDEPDTINWYALQIGPSTFGIFDTFNNEAGREAHLNGRIAAALFDKADELLSAEPVIEKVEILAFK